MKVWQEILPAPAGRAGEILLLAVHNVLVCVFAWPPSGAAVKIGLICFNIMQLFFSHGLLFFLVGHHHLIHCTE